MIRKVGALVGYSLLAWGLVVYPAWLLDGGTGIFLSGAALVLCLIPAAVTLGWAAAIAQKSPEKLVLICMAGGGLRLAVVLGGGLFLHFAFPATFPRAFWVWLLVFYILTLTLEMVLLLKSHSQPDGERGASTP